MAVYGFFSGLHIIMTCITLVSCMYVHGEIFNITWILLYIIMFMTTCSFLCIVGEGSKYVSVGRVSWPTQMEK